MQFETAVVFAAFEMKMGVKSLFIKDIIDKGDLAS
jgi:hypothetical protein